MLTTIVAVLGTLAGALAAGLMQARIARTARDDARDDARRREAVDAVTTLAVAISDHRRAMWQLGDSRLTGTEDKRVRELRDETHRTRSAITAPAVRVQLLTPAVQESARAAIQATYAMRDVETTPGALATARQAAIDAHDQFIDRAAAYLTTTV
jgi:hypothetical protein